jgi:hypothetical protein
MSLLQSTNAHATNKKNQEKILNCSKNTKKNLRASLYLISQQNILGFVTIFFKKYGTGKVYENINL